MIRQRAKKLRTTVEQRRPQERALVLAALGALLGYLWFIFVWEPFDARRQGLERQLESVRSQVRDQEARQLELVALAGEDPDALLRQRIEQLRAETQAIDARLRELYGQLISPTEMVTVLTDIVRESPLRLVSLENLPPAPLYQGELNAAPLEADAGKWEAGDERRIRVFRHGLRMVFEGSYLDTLDYLRSLEKLDTNFFWQEFRFVVANWPNARVEISLYTLSTREEWIGV